MNLLNFVLISLFNGASIAQTALYNIGIYPEAVYTSEVDKHALLHEQSIYPENIVLGDVTEINFSALLEDIKRDFGEDVHIMLVGGSPCQNFSFVGSRKGMVTKDNIEVTTLSQYLEFKSKGFEFHGSSFLFWEFMRAKRELNPTTFLLENVRMANDSKEVITQAMGCDPVEYDSALLSAQQRKRLYWFNWENPTIEDIGVKLYDVLDHSEPFRPIGKWVLSTNWGTSQKKHSKLDKLRTVYSEKSFTLTTKKTHSSQYYLNADRTMYRNLTIKEFEELQTFPKDWTKVKGIPTGARYKLVGNAWTLDVIEELFIALI